MTDPIDFSQWARQWEATMRELMARMPDAGNAAALGTTPWGTLGTSPTQGEAIERMLAAAQGYLGLLQSLTSPAAVQGTGGVGTIPPWLSALGNSAGFAPASAPWFANPVSQAMRGVGMQGAAGFEQLMERFASAAGPMLDGAKGALDLPAFGFLREHQEEAQATAKSLVDYQEQMARYNRLMLKVGEQGFARFQLKLAEREEPGRQVESVRGLYDLWIDAVEEAYAEIALSEEFREVYGALVNAQMRVREHVQRKVERFSNEVGVPTRSEVDSIGQRLQALRREFRAEREANGDILALTAEVAALRDEVASLRARREPAAASNVVAFGRAQHVAAKTAEPAASVKKRAAKAPRSRSAARKAKSVPQVARAASRTAAPPPKPKPKPAHASRAKVATPATRLRADKPSFAARMARFARANVDAGKAGMNPKSKPSRR
ncbi:MAG TPA: class III poly(R)-hydroxyalkanoic acid synthase subunit PhaE [Dokdonella sp.]|uniref:class III poly(R)-hydroxyalkanoic acid synthase subunit PhaE n=1 Tax=Dokdonella sp. TaxID=2291710 RepID=UPI0025C42193|nr:class III poly(R)-hydroxyalkanoic acid synthase subunit PhaE [Dokdonella sp.]MBX3693157.1 class III poly(R)-hydroxyalkanoic acid synthase subunit PhaE [Dokdonella sp.]HNR92122.1 class III poly(R)-hydroxyalkanoic acid synthase subunit PhaE [Dokdonella sp.]